MRNGYMTVETTALHGSVCFSLRATKDIENGAIVGKGDLVTGETSIYTALDDYSDGMYLVANPAWVYEVYKATDMNEENYINKASIPFRVYKLEKDMKYKISNIADGVTLAVGDYVKFESGAYAKSSDATQLKVVAIEELGFPYCIGSAGTESTEYGYAIGKVTKKYTIEVVNTPASTSAVGD